MNPEDKKMYVMNSTYSIIPRKVTTIPWPKHGHAYLIPWHPTLDLDYARYASMVILDAISISNMSTH